MTTVPTPWTTPCNCAWRNDWNHDDLLSVETDFNVAAELTAYVDAIADYDHTGVSPADLPAFASAHRWANPQAVLRMFSALQSLDTARRPEIDAVPA